MSKELSPLEAFEKLKNKPTLTTDWYKRKTAYDYNKLEYDIIETALKVLEIIKKKKVNIQALFYSTSCEDYNKHYNHYEDLAQEEYELLKEFLQ